MPSSKAATTHAPRARVATRRRGLLVLTVAALLVVPVAISWACGPNRAIQLDRHTYAPSAPVTVTGANFFEDVDITFRLGDGTVVATTRTSAVGNLRVTFNAPATAGAYTVVAHGIDPDTGQALAGTGGRESFTVAAPAPTTNAPSGNTPSTGNTPAPGATTGTQPGTSRQTGRNRTSGRERAPAPGRERSGTGSQSAPSGGGTGTAAGGVNTSDGVVQAGGRSAFAGSVTRQDRATAAEAKAKAKAGAASPSTASPSTSTAVADLWEGFASGKNPSLVPNASDSGAPAAGTSSGVVAGLALLGVGLLGLLGLGGLIAAGRRKGRARAS